MSCGFSDFYQYNSKISLCFCVQNMFYLYKMIMKAWNWLTIDMFAVSCLIPTDQIILLGFWSPIIKFVTSCLLLFSVVTNFNLFFSALLLLFSRLWLFLLDDIVIQLHNFNWNSVDKRNISCQIKLKLFLNK